MHWSIQNCYLPCSVYGLLVCWTFQQDGLAKGEAHNHNGGEDCITLTGGLTIGLDDSCVYELRLYGFAENRQPPQKPPEEKENELKVNKYSCISHSAALSC